MPLGKGEWATDEEYRAELEAYFKLFYQARTLKPGSRFDFAMITNLTALPYRNEALTQLQQTQATVDQGKLLEVSYSDIEVLTFEPPEPMSHVTIKRTQTYVGSDGKPSVETVELRFQMRRIVLPGLIASWEAYNLLTPEINPGVTPEMIRQSAIEQAEPEIRDFFNRFYAARTLTPGGKFDLATSGQLAQLGYQQYTIPLLEKQQEDANAGKLTSVRYSDLAIKLETWDSNGTEHGALAEVEVTRTAHTLRPGKPEEQQTASYRFRLHRHNAGESEDGKPYWVAYDFLIPTTKEWVSESAGYRGIVPSIIHG